MKYNKSMTAVLASCALGLLTAMPIVVQAEYNKNEMCIANGNTIPITREQQCAPRRGRIYHLDASLKHDEVCIVNGKKYSARSVRHCLINGKIYTKVELHHLG